MHKKNIDPLSSQSEAINAKLKHEKRNKARHNKKHLVVKNNKNTIPKIPGRGFMYFTDCRQILTLSPNVWKAETVKSSTICIFKYNRRIRNEILHFQIKRSVTSHGTIDIQVRLNQIKSYLSQQLRVLFYNAYIKPHLE